MPESFEEDDAYRGGEVEAANAWIRHRNLKAVVPVCAQEIFWKTASFAAKDETVIGLKAPVSVKLLRFSREINEACLRQRFVKRSEIFVTSELYFRPVVEARAFQSAIVHTKASDTDDVQRHVSGGTQPRDVAGVRWNLRFDESDGDHGSIINKKETTSFA